MIQPENILSMFIRQILGKLQVRSGDLKLLIDHHNKLTRTTVYNVINARNQILDELKRDKMTIKSFFKQLAILRIRNVKITIEIETFRHQKHSFDQTFSLVETENLPTEEELDVKDE